MKSKYLRSTDLKITPLIVVAALLGLSLGAAFVLFHFFESFAEIENKGVKLGGAIAGFVAIFFLLRHTYFKLTSLDAASGTRSAEEQIQVLETQLKQILIGTLENFLVPEGFKPFVSPEFRFGICFPEEWVFVPFPQMTMYGIAIDAGHSEEIGFGRNVNIMISQVEPGASEDKDIAEITREATLSVLPNSELVLEEHFLCQGQRALRQIVNYQPNNQKELTAYQIKVLNPTQQQLVIVTYTTTKEDFEGSRKLFDDILGTLRLSGTSPILRKIGAGQNNAMQSDARTSRR